MRMIYTLGHYLLGRNLRLPSPALKSIIAHGNPEIQFTLCSPSAPDKTTYCVGSKETSAWQSTLTAIDEVQSIVTRATKPTHGLLSSNLCSDLQSAAVDSEMQCVELDAEDYVLRRSHRWGARIP